MNWLILILASMAVVLRRRSDSRLGYALWTLVAVAFIVCLCARLLHFL